MSIKERRTIFRNTPYRGKIDFNAHFKSKLSRYPITQLRHLVGLIQGFSVFEWNNDKSREVGIFFKPFYFSIWCTGKFCMVPGFGGTNYLVPLSIDNETFHKGKLKQSQHRIT